MVDSLSGWLVERLSNWLTTKGACEMLSTSKELDATKLIIKDIFGQVYEVQIKAINRISEVNDDNYYKSINRNSVGLARNTDLI